MAVVSNCLNLTKNEFTWCGFTNFISKFLQVRIISVSCDCKPFIFKICQTVAGPSFNRFLKSDFDWFLPFGPPNCVTSIKIWRVKNLHSLLKIPLTMIRLCTYIRSLTFACLIWMVNFVLTCTYLTQDIMCIEAKAYWSTAWIMYVSVM